ncbi:hypothetical protein TcasGA2_TC009291 [Tribolium castaneum]|uniref:Uncharacterized protein n=1 Tax=Tribolium castaneum TaxID=7070 RepID=D6WRZ5_TRICA|nr:hypothetical protein TcasGA2_TC009291 [Tribolium castaneum]
MRKYHASEFSVNYVIRKNRPIFPCGIRTVLHVHSIVQRNSLTICFIQANKQFVAVQRNEELCGENREKLAAKFTCTSSVKLTACYRTLDSNKTKRSRSINRSRAVVVAVYSDEPRVCICGGVDEETAAKEVDNCEDLRSKCRALKGTDGK